MKQKFLITTLLATQVAFAQNAQVDESVFDSAYADYIQLSQDYVQNQKETLEALRKWRKSMLVENYTSRLDLIEKNLNLSNTNLIGNFEQFIKENGNDSLDDVLVLRLIQLNYEKANLDFNAEMKKYQQQIDLYSKGLIKEAPEAPVPNYKETIRIANDFSKTFPQSPLRDKAIYLIGFCSEEMGLLEEALANYKKLFDNFPNSAFFDEVVWRAADIYFMNQQYRESEVLYNRLVQLQSSYKLKARYRLGAVLFAEKKFESAVQVFEELAQLITNVNSKTPEEETLLDESLDYLAAIVSQAPQLKVSSQFGPEIYYRLGQIYKKRLDEDSLKATYTYAIQTFPYSPWMPRIYSELIQVSEEDGDLNKVNMYRNRLIQLLTANETWWVRNDNFKTATFEAQDLLEYNLLKSAQFYANQGYKNSNLDLLETARSRYFNFINQYSWSPYAERAKLELADIEYFLGRYAIASKYYFELVNQAESEVIREEAAYSLIWSESKKVKYDLTFSANFYLPKAQDKTPLSLQENIFIQASAYYVNKIPRSSRRNKVLYKMAEVYASHGELDLAVQTLNTLISDIENADFMTVSGFRLLTDIYNVKNDWKSVQVVQELQKSTSFLPSLADQDKDNLIARQQEKLEKALSAELKGDYAKAVELFELFLVENSRSTAVPMVQLKLAVLYDKLNLMPKMQDTLLKLERSAFAAEAAYLKAHMASKQSLFDDAAKMFEGFVAQFPKHNWTEAAALSAISIRSQMRQYAMILDFMNKQKLTLLSTDFFFTYIHALLELKKYNDVVKVANSYPNRSRIDSSRILNYVLKAYFSRDDFISLSRTCPQVKTLEGSKDKTAFLNFNLAFCQYVDLRTIVTVPETRMDQIQTELTEIASYKVDDVILAAVNTVLELSDLKTNNQAAFLAITQKAWDIAKQIPFHPESKRLAKNYYQIFSRYPIHLGHLVNWRLSLHKLYDFKNLAQPEWKALQSSCQKDLPDCVSGLEQLQKNNPQSESIYENLILAHLNRGDDAAAVKVLNAYAQTLNWPQSAVDLFFVMGIANQIPAEKLKYEGQLSSPLGILAVIEREIEAKNYKEALKFIKLNLGVHPQYPQTYARAAQLYYDRGFPELARTVIQNGYVNTQSPILESMLYQLNSVMYSNTNVTQSTQDLGPVVSYGLAFASLKNKDTKTFEAMNQKLSPYPLYQQNLKLSSQMYNDTKINVPDSLASYHTQWLSKLDTFSRLQNPTNFESLRDVFNLGYKHPAFLDVDQTSNFRAPAGGL